MKIYIERVGSFDAVTEWETILWFWEQSLKNRPKGYITKFWLRIQQCYMEGLIKDQAYELVHHIKQNVKADAEKRREYYLKKQREKAALELENFEKLKLRIQLIKNICLN